MKKNPTSIKFSSSIYTDNNKIEDMPISKFIELARKKGNSIQSWSETVEYEGEEKEILSKLKKLSDISPLTNGLQRQLQDNSSKLVICDMGDELGFGVYTARPIGKCEIIGVYSGSVCMFDTENINYNTHSLRIYEDKEKTITCDAFKKGNVTRFIQHAFDDENSAIYNSCFELVNKNAAKANVGYQMYSVGNQIFRAVVTKRKVREGEMLFSDYGLLYWEILNKRPKSFNSYGQILESKATGYRLRIQGTSRILDMGYRYIPETIIEPIFKLQVILTAIQKDKPLTFESEYIEHASVYPKILKENLESNPDALVWHIRTPFFKCNEDLRRCLSAILKHQTRLNWEFQSESLSATAILDDDVFNYLRQFGFNISKAYSTHLLKPFKMTLNLGQEVDQDKLIEIPPIETGPDFRLVSSLPNPKLVALLSK